MPFPSIISIYTGIFWVCRKINHFDHSNEHIGLILIDILIKFFEKENYLHLNLLKMKVLLKIKTKYDTESYGWILGQIPPLVYFRDLMESFSNESTLELWVFNS